MPPTPRDPDDVHMSIGDHLEDLRKRLLLALAGVGVAFGVTLWYGRPLVVWLCQPLNTAQKLAGLAPQTYSFGPATSFTIYLKVATIAAFVLASPWILYQAWKFVELGLYRSERRIVLVLAPFSALMSALGVLFMYYVMVPVCLWFFITWAVTYPPVKEAPPSWMFNVLTQTKGMKWLGFADTHELTDTPEVPPPPGVPPEAPAPPVVIPRLEADPADPADGQVWVKVPQNELRVRISGHTRSTPLTTTTLMSPLIEISEYLEFVAMVTVGIVITFQTPVVMLIGAWSGLISAATLASYRRHCVFACFFIGMICTPSDVLSMLVLAFPLWGLYELGLVLMRVVERQRPQET